MTKYDLLQHVPMPRLLGRLKGLDLFGPGPIVLARAPGRLDVMGGIADYSGSLVCEMPLGVAAGVAVQTRNDDVIVCRSEQVDRTVRVAVGEVAVERPDQVARSLAPEDKWARYPLGCLWWLSRRRVRIPGVTLVIDSEVPLGGGVSSSAAIEVATMMALCDLLGVELSPLELAVACQEVENRVVGAPCGVMDQVTAAMGRQDALLQILCQAGEDGLPAQVLGHARVPQGYAFIGIDSGVQHEVSGDPYTDTRVAAFIAQRILSISEDHDPTAGHLANVDPDRYRRELRQRLPERMAGQAFLDTYGHTNDPVTAVVPEKIYPVRHAATHHVLEHQRVRRFVDLLEKAGEDHHPEPLMRRAGRLMLASHWSYGLRASLGHPLTDQLVRSFSHQGVMAGFYGAKITGGGCGGTVAVLVRDEPVVHEQVERLRQLYTAQTGRDTILFNTSSPGAAALGTARVTLEGRA